MSFGCGTLRLTGLAAGQRVVAGNSNQIPITPAGSCPFGAGMCFRISTSSAPPTLMPGWSTPCVSQPVAGNYINLSGTGAFTAPTDGDYDVGMCFFLVTGFTGNPTNGQTTATVYAP